jgi:hypothetical protein
MVSVGDARNMSRLGINIYEKRSVRKVGHLKELHREAWSTKHKIPFFLSDFIQICVLSIDF